MKSSNLSEESGEAMTMNTKIFVLEMSNNTKQQ